MHVNMCSCMSIGSLQNFPLARSRNTRVESMKVPSYAYMSIYVRMSARTQTDVTKTVKFQCWSEIA